MDTDFFDLEKFEDPNVRYYACVVDKNRAGAKPRVLFRLNLAYNSWQELRIFKVKTIIDFDAIWYYNNLCKKSKWRSLCII